MNITTLLTLQRELSGERSKDLNKLIAKALIYIVENYFLQLSPSFVLILSCRRNRACHLHNDLMERLFRKWDAPPLQIVQMPKNGTFYVPGRRFFNLIFVDSFESFKAIDIIKYTAKYNINEYYYIFLQTRENLSAIEMSRIFEYCWMNQIINCNVQVQTENREILIYTYYPYTKNKCGEPTIRLINSFNGTTLNNEVLFPKKLLNFYGCKLRAATWNVHPFIYLEKAANGSSQIKRGVEARVILELAKKLNFVIDVIVPPNDEQRGVLKGENSTGALGMLDKRLVDFSVGFFRLSYDRASLATATFSYYTSTQIVCASLSAYKFSSIEILLYPFATSTWLLLLVIWVSSIALTAAKNKYYSLHPSRFSNPASKHFQLNMLLMAIGMPSTKMPTYLIARLLCTDWMLFFLVIRTAYQALLFHLIRTQPTNPLPTSFDDLVKHNYTVVINRSTFLSFTDVEFLKELHLKIINETAETVAFEFLDKNQGKHLVAGGPLDFLAHYIIEFKKTGVFHVLPQNIFSLPLTMYLTKHSFLVNRFDEELKIMCSMGFLHKWSRWELDFGYLRNARAMDIEVFDLNDLYALFIAGFVGIVVSLIVFLLEILSPRFAYLKRFFMRF